MIIILYFRAVGPAGPRLVQRIRPDLMHKYEGLIEEDNLKVLFIFLSILRKNRTYPNMTKSNIFTTIEQPPPPPYFQFIEIFRGGFCSQQGTLKLKTA